MHFSYYMNSSPSTKVILSLDPGGNTICVLEYCPVITSEAEFEGVAYGPATIKVKSYPNPPH